MSAAPVPSTHAQGAPATAYALAALAATPVYDTAAELLALAALADRDWYGPDGYSGHTAEEVALLLDRDGDGDVTDALAALTAARVLDRREDGRFRIPQAAYDRANGE